jgi:hypothetical protein
MSKRKYPKKNNKSSLQKGQPLISHKTFTQKKQQNQQTPQNPSIKHEGKQGEKNNNRHPEKPALFFNTHFSGK